MSLLSDLVVKGVEKKVAKQAAEAAARQVEERAALAVPKRRMKPKVRTDNPGGGWLEHERRRADERVRSGDTKISGAVTGYLAKPIELDPRKLEVIPGAMNERRVPGEFQYDLLRPSIEKHGYQQGDPILVGINHLGEPYIIEGNTRAAVARDLGIDRIPAEVRYFAGGERVGGLMEPRLLEHYMPPSELSLDPNFRRWFEGSKGVDEYGEPKMFYHGTMVSPNYGLGDFSVFDRNSSVSRVGRKPSMDTVGSWFSDRADEQGAGMYAGYHREGQQPSEGFSGAIMPVYLKYTNPWKPSSFEEFLQRGNELDWEYDAARPGLFNTEPLREWLKERGHDAIQFPRGLDGGDQVATVVLEPTQIKSATGNRGTYDPEDPDIRKARGGLAVKRKRK